MTYKGMNFLDIFVDVAQRFPSSPALTDFSTLGGGDGNAYSYAEWYDEVLQLCGVFRSLGLNRGDHIAICGHNSANWVVAYFAITAFGGIAVTTPVNLTYEEISNLIAFSDSAALIADNDIIAAAQNEKHLMATISLNDFSIVSGDLLCSVSPFSCIVHSEFNQVAQICFTTGSTSSPKAVVLSYGNLSNNLKNAYENLPYCQSNSSIAILPLSHTYGMLGGVLCQIPGAHNIFFLGSALSSETLVRSMLCVNPYSVVIVPSIVETLYKRFGGRIKYILGDNLQQLLVGGAALDRKIEDDLLALGIPLTVGYGMTETGPLIGANLWSNYVPHSCGRVVSGMEARVSDEGEILVRGDNVMLGYYKNPEATRRKIDADGWLHTGDRGRVDDDGTVYVYGRLEQDIIVLPSGENIIPQNIEAMLNRIDGVAESLVLERSGQLVALVYPRETGLDKNALLRAVNVRLPSFSQLSDIEFVPEPFQRTGKSGIKRYLYQTPQNVS